METDEIGLLTLFRLTLMENVFQRIWSWNFFLRNLVRKKCTVSYDRTMV